MKRILILFLLLGFGGTSFLACTTQNESQETAEEIERDLDEVENDLEQEKVEFSRESESRLKRINARLDRIENDIEAGGAEVKAESRERLNNLRQNSRDLSTRLSKIGDSTKETWKDLKSEVNREFDELERDIDETFD